MALSFQKCLSVCRHPNDLIHLLILLIACTSAAGGCGTGAVRRELEFDVGGRGDLRGVGAIIPMRLDSDFWLHDYTFERRLAGLDVYVFQRHTLAARFVHIVEPRDGELLRAQAAIARVTIAVACVRDGRRRRLVGRFLGDGRQRRVAVQMRILGAAVMRFLPARPFAVKCDRLLFVVHRF